MNEELLLLSKVLKNRGFTVHLCENSGQVNDILNLIFSESEEIKSIG